VKTEKTIVLIGAGNLASHLAPALKKLNFRILQVVSRTISSATGLAEKVDAAAETDFSRIISDADYYLICVSDSQIEKVIKDLKPEKKFLIHTSGSTGMNIFTKYCSRYGVLYPLQTFSKAREVDLRQVPFFIEASSAIEYEELDKIARGLSDNVRPGDSELRVFLHICAVFTCSFTNHMYRIADEICREKGIPFEFLHPLILETAEKAGRMSPSIAQTGPVSRNDQEILKKHLDLLQQYPEFRKIYTFVAASILKMNGHSPDFLNTTSAKHE
jgi:predicted short-subunit dehydrogenase-like oxidoreductase (DUF2520 family)